MAGAELGEPRPATDGDPSRPVALGPVRRRAARYFDLQRDAV